jgi:SNF family Na+-dependent transporter
MSGITSRSYHTPYFIAVFMFELGLIILEIVMGRHFRRTVVTPIYLE